MNDTQPLHRVKHPPKGSKAPTWLVVSIGIAAAWLVIMAIVAATGFADGINSDVASVTKQGAHSGEQATTLPQLTSAPPAHPSTVTMTAPGSTVTVTEHAEAITVRAPGSTVTVTRPAPAARTETVTQPAPPAQTVTETAPGSTVTVTRTRTVCAPLPSC